MNPFYLMNLMLEWQSLQFKTPNLLLSVSVNVLQLELDLRRLVLVQRILIFNFSNLPCSRCSAPSARPSRASPNSAPRPCFNHPAAIAPPNSNSPAVFSPFRTSPRRSSFASPNALNSPRNRPRLYHFSSPPQPNLFPTPSARIRWFPKWKCTCLRPRSRSKTSRRKWTSLSWRFNCAPNTPCAAASSRSPGTRITLSSPTPPLWPKRSSLNCSCRRCSHRSRRASGRSPGRFSPAGRSRCSSWSPSCPRPSSPFCPSRWRIWARIRLSSRRWCFRRRTSRGCSARFGGSPWLVAGCPAASPPKCLLSRPGRPGRARRRQACRPWS